MFRERWKRWMLLGHTEQELNAFNDRIAYDNLRYLMDYYTLFIPAILVAGAVYWFLPSADPRLRLRFLLPIAVLLLTRPVVRWMIRERQLKYSRLMCTGFIVLVYFSALYYDVRLYPEDVNVMQCIALVAFNMFFDGRPRVNFSLTAAALCVSIGIEHGNVRDALTVANTFNYILAAVLGCPMGWYRSKNHYDALIHEEEEKKIRERETRTRLMLTQVQPHFICNSLASISVLCDMDPKQAQVYIDQLCTVLRENINAAVGGAQLIPVAQEVANVRRYADLELLRYGKMLNIVYDIADVDFGVPSLTIQPVLSNAVSHGVGQKPGGGTVSLSVREEGANYVITVQDNGVGVDAKSIDEIKLSSDREHIGLESVRERIRTLTGGDVFFTSASGVGTTVRIEIPKR